MDISDNVSAIADISGIFDMKDHETYALHSWAI